MPLKSLVARCDKLANLAPLAGMKLETLDLEYTAVDDITPLQGMPLRALNMGTCKKLHDLSPLAGVSLTSIVLPPPEAAKIEAMCDMKTLTSINSHPPRISGSSGTRRRRKRCPPWTIPRRLP